MTKTAPSANAPAAMPRGVALLRDPRLNKGMAFNERERDALGLRGLLPPHVLSQAEQVARVLENFRRLASPLEQYIFLAALQERNEALFFRLVTDHPDEMMPVIYTPTVGLACEQFAHIFQRPRGLFLCADDRGRVDSILANWPHQDVSIIVVTDGERILGLGDLGANGMGIPVGKLSLYTACAGVHPRLCLPVVIDAGTNNQRLREDPLYIGLRRPRVRGAAYDELVEEFVSAANRRFPGVLIQFEDFATENAFGLLARYRDRVCTFNDDIQGTAAVTLAGVLSALRVTRKRLAEQKVLFLGAGEAATGIADLIVAAMKAEGVPEREARARCWLFDSKALVVESRTDLATHKRPYAHPHGAVATFADAVRELAPTAIVGVAAVPNTFCQEVVGEMARINERPIVFALSNPTAKSECTAEQAYRWSGGRALFASGSPFDPVQLDGRTFVPRQGNNSYVFPGVGLGVIAVRAKHVTDAMFLAAAHALAGEVSDADLAQGSLYPPLAAIRDVSAQIAVAVAKTAYEQRCAGITRPADLMEHIRAQMYDPHYTRYA